MVRIYEKDFQKKPEPVNEAPVIATEPEVVEEIEAAVPVEVEQKKDGVVLKLGDMWLKSMRPYVKTDKKEDAIILDLKLAESYLPRISLYRGIKAEIIPA